MWNSSASKTFSYQSPFSLSPGKYFVSANDQIKNYILFSSLDEKALSLLDRMPELIGIFYLFISQVP